VGATRKKVTGAIEYLKGKLQRSVGRRKGDRPAQAKGFGRQAKGGIRYKTGEAQGKMKKQPKKQPKQKS
jgi:uncharacterized protein YjbJ (UPF0337 family)